MSRLSVLSPRGWYTLGLAVLGGPSVCAQEVLSVDDAIAQVLARNYTLRIAAVDPEIAAQNVRSAAGDFDPAVFGEYRYDRGENAFSPTDSEAAQASLGVVGELPWGAQYDASVTSIDTTEPFVDTFFDPLDPTVSVAQISTSVTSRAAITVTQPILRGFGRDARAAGLFLAENAEAQSLEFFRATLIDTITTTVRAYYEMLLSRENLAVSVQNRDRAAQLLADNRRRVEEGVLAPLDLVQAQSEVALREVNVVQASRAARLAENQLRRLLHDDPTVILDTTLDLAPLPELIERPVNVASDYVQALEHRPDVRLAQLVLDAEGIRVRQTRRDSRPQLDLFASYGLTATEETLDDSLGQLGNREANYGIGARFSIPFPNRTRDAARISAALRENQAELELRRIEQETLIAVDNAANRIETDWQRIQASREARELAQSALDAEEKKLQAGTSSTFVVLRLQGDLADARVREIAALTDYAVALAEYDAALGLTLVRRGVTLE